MHASFLCSAGCLLCPTQPTVIWVIHTLTMNYGMSGLIYSAFRRGLELGICQSKNALRPGSSADGLPRENSEKHEFIRWLQMYPWLGGSWGSCQTDCLPLSQVPRRAPQRITQVAVQTCSVSRSVTLVLSLTLGYKQASCINEDGDRPSASINIVIPTPDLSRKHSCSLALRLMWGRIPSFNFSTGNQFSWHRPSSMSWVPWKLILEYIQRNR